MKGCCCAEHGHHFVLFEGEKRCDPCGYYLVNLIEDGECSLCGERHAEASCDWTEPAR